MGQAFSQLAIGIVRRAGEVLVVQEDLLADGSLGWSLPGGGVEAGETFVDAVVREVHEECGVLTEPVGGAAFVVNSSSQQYPSAVAIAFELAVAQDGQDDAVQPEDADIIRAEFVPIGEAIRRVSQIPSAVQRDPIVAYLNGDAPPGSVWGYRIEDGTEQLVTRLCGGARVCSVDDVVQ